MTTLAADKPRKYESGFDPVFNDLPVTASDIIYEGAAVTTNASGYCIPASAAAESSGTLIFAGFADKKADNSAGAAGAINVHLRTQGIVELPVTAATSIADVGKSVYLRDDDLFTLTSSTAGSTKLIGRVVRWVTGTTCMVAFYSASMDIEVA